MGPTTGAIVGSGVGEAIVADEDIGTFADIAKITQDTSWKPEIDIEKGVSIMLENISYWADAPLWDIQQTPSR